MPRGDKFDSSKLSKQQLLQDDVFKALSDASRRKLLSLIYKEPRVNVTDLCAYFPQSRFAIMKHLNVLEKARLVRRERSGNSSVFVVDTLRLLSVLNSFSTEFSASNRSHRTTNKATVRNAGRSRILQKVAVKD